MSKVRLLSALTLGLLAATGSFEPVSAQAPERSGFFIGFGLGGGSFGVENAPERQSSASGYFKLGGALNDRILLGAESSAWVKEEAGFTLTSGSLNATVYVYPNPAGGFFLQGGVGVATLELDAGAFGDGGTNGTALNVGAGYDFGFGGRFGLTPYGSLVFSNFDGGSTTLFHIGLGVNWY